MNPVIIIRFYESAFSFVDGKVKMSHTNSKNQKIQILRAIAICAVVAIHTEPPYLFGILARSFVNFAVSMFFFLSGYLTKLEYDDWFSFFKKRISRVVVPYIFWSLSWVLYGFIVSRHYDHLLFQLLTGQCVYPYYFVFVYVQFVLFTPWISRLIKSHYRWVGWLIQPAAIVLLRYYGLEKHLGFSVLFSWFTPYYLGMILGNHILDYSLSRKKTIFLWFVSLVLSIGEGLIWNHLGNYDLATTQESISNCLYSIACMLLAYHYINDDNLTIQNNFVNNLLILLGDCSFGIFLIHAFIILIVARSPLYQHLFFPLYVFSADEKSLARQLGKNGLILNHPKSIPLTPINRPMQSKLYLSIIQGAIS